MQLKCQMLVFKVGIKDPVIAQFTGYQVTLSTWQDEANEVDACCVIVAEEILTLWRDTSMLELYYWHS